MQKSLFSGKMNKRGVLPIGVLLSLLVAIIVLAMIPFTLNKIKTNLGSGTTANTNTTFTNGDSAAVTISGLLPAIGAILAVVIIIRLLVGSFGGFKGDGF